MLPALASSHSRHSASTTLLDARSRLILPAGIAVGFPPSVGVHEEDASLSECKAACDHASPNCASFAYSSGKRSCLLKVPASHCLLAVPVRGAPVLSFTPTW